MKQLVHSLTQLAHQVQWNFMYVVLYPNLALSRLHIRCISLAVFLLIMSCLLPCVSDSSFVLSYSSHFSPWCSVHRHAQSTRGWWLFVKKNRHEADGDEMKALTAHLKKNPCDAWKTTTPTCFRSSSDFFWLLPQSKTVKNYNMINAIHYFLSIYII